MAKPRRENTATQVYAAQGVDCVKVGVSRIVGKREKQLRDHGGMTFKVIRTWDHRDPLAIEAMVCEVFAYEYAVVFGREVFSVTMRELAVEIERAIARYERSGMTLETKLDKHNLCCIRIDDNIRRGVRRFKREPMPDLNW